MKILLMTFTLLISGTALAGFRVDKEIKIVSEIEYDSWVQRPQFPYEIKKKHLSATYTTDENEYLLRFTCGPIGHTIRLLEKIHGQSRLVEKAYIRLHVTFGGKRKCRKIVENLHKTHLKNTGKGLATLQLMDRSKNGRRPHIPSIHYKAKIKY